MARSVSSACPSTIIPPIKRVPPRPLPASGGPSTTPPQTYARRDLGRCSDWQILPDLPLERTGDPFAIIESAVQQQLKDGYRLICLGGDHSVTLPIIRAHSRIYQDLNILHFDAHPDLYEELDGNRYSHACPFARIMEERLVKRLVQVGIRTLTPHQYDQAQRFGVEIIEMQNIREANDLSFDGPLYLSLDMDCLDPAYAPGVSHHEPGGMSTREILTVLQSVRGKLVGADLVEYNPERDLNGMTGMVAAKLLKELLDKMMTANY